LKGISLRPFGLNSTRHAMSAYCSQSSGQRGSEANAQCRTSRTAPAGRRRLECVEGERAVSAPDLSEANLIEASLVRANLSEANLFEASLVRATLSGANLSGATLCETNLREADLSGASLSGADLSGANLFGAALTVANLSGAGLGGANLRLADLSGADLTNAVLHGADLSGATLIEANLADADMSRAMLVEINLADAVLTGCRIYGVSAWDMKLEGTKQNDLIITRRDEPDVTVDNIEVAQFVYLLLHNEKIRDVIDTIGRKGVLVLGRFTEGRIEVLNRLREELRQRGYLPIVFNFDKPETKDFTETVRLLAGLSKFVIADVTNPKSAPLELQATVPEIMVPFLPIIEEGQEPFAMLTDLWIKHREWLFEPLHYSSLDALVGALDEEIIGPAETRFDKLIVRKAETMKGRHV
jgi:uncharacterized protein YjbI with pentapeptide repeats